MSIPAASILDGNGHVAQLKSSHEARPVTSRQRLVSRCTARVPPANAAAGGRFSVSRTPPGFRRHWWLPNATRETQDIRSSTCRRSGINAAAVREIGPAAATYRVPGCRPHSAPARIHIGRIPRVPARLCGKWSDHYRSATIDCKGPHTARAERATRLALYCTMSRAFQVASPLSPAVQELPLLIGAPPSECRSVPSCVARLYRAGTFLGNTTRWLQTDGHAQ
jgi:hypothetical protein